MYYFLDKFFILFLQEKNVGWKFDVFKLKIRFQWIKTISTMKHVSKTIRQTIDCIKPFVDIDIK